ncbi:MAG: lipopolysaccharide heptosyltransferase II [Nitrospiraceae bacterium]
MVRGPNWIGDAVMSEPALAALRELFPTAEITLLVKPAIAELLRGHPALQRILVYEDPGRHVGITGKWTLAGTLRRLRFDLAILFQNAFEAALLTFLAGIPRRYGYATDGRRFLLSDPIAVPERTKIGHQVQYYLDMLRPLGSERPAGSPRLFLSHEEEQAMNQRLAEAGVDESDLLVGLNPGSTYGSAKRWLPERFAETADRLSQEQGMQSGRRVRVVTVGARGEEALGRAIADRMQVKPLQLSGRTTMRELMAVIKRCDLFLTNDTGPMHLAASFGVPVVALFGPTDSRTTSPFGSGHTIVRHPVECSPCLLRECPIDHRCMTRISVDEVYEAAAKQLTGLSGSSSLSSSNKTYQTNQTNQINQINLLRGVTVFLDRDGTMNRDPGYVKTPEELELFPGVVKAVARLNRAGARVVTITNQSGIARGLLTVSTLEQVHDRLRALLKAGGACLDGIYVCPHAPDEGCGCRKPGTALVERAVADLGLDLSGAYVVGDQKRDVELAVRIGAKSLLVMTGPTSLQALADLQAEGRRPDYVAPGLVEAVEWIIEDVKARQSLTV